MDAGKVNNIPQSTITTSSLPPAGKLFKALQNTGDSFTPAAGKKEPQKVDMDFVSKVVLGRNDGQGAPTTPLWVFEPQSGSFNLPCSGPDGKVYVADGNTVFALDGQKGVARKEFTIPGDITHFAISDNGYVYATDENGAYGFYKNKGKIKWENKQQFWGKPSIGEKHISVDSKEKVYLTDYHSGVYAINGRSGKTKWFCWETYLPHPPLLSSDEQALFIVDANSKLTAVETSRGDYLWDFRTSFPTGDMKITPTPDGDVIVGYENFYLLACLDGKTGERKWTGPDTEGMLAPPVMSYDGSSVYIPDKSGRIVSLDAGTGEQKWEFTMPMKDGKEIRQWGLGGEEISVTAAYDGTVFIGKEDDTIIALEGSTGHKKWTFAVDGEEILRPIAGDDGNIYIRGGSGKIYCLPFDIEKMAQNHAEQKEEDGWETIAPKITLGKDFVDIDGVKLPIGSITRE